MLWRWIWAAMVVSIMVCALIAWLHYQQRQVLGQSIATLDAIRQARIDLVEGFTHITLARDPAMPFDREQGLALLDQSIRSFEASAALLDPQDEAVAAFQHDVEAFRAQLAEWRTTGMTPRTVVELSVSLNQLEREADRFDAQLRASLRGQSARLDRIFVWVLSGAAMLLASICGAMLVLERTARAAERALRASEARQQIALQAGQLGTWEWNPATNTVMLDATGRHLLGVTTEAFTVQEMYAGIHPDDLPSTKAALRASIEQRVLYDHEARWLLPDGSLHWLRGIGRPIESADGSLIGFYGIASDITARKQTENQIRQLNAELEQRVTERTTELGSALNRAQTLYAITNDAIASGNLVEALQRAIDRAGTTINADRVAMLIFDWETRSIEQFLYAGRGKEHVSTSVDFDELMRGYSNNQDALARRRIIMRMEAR
ncbi:MAG: PAS domain-containing protein [Oscillochloris sp.]|nr:PAS domain-containing protein [Oscillochloris sp.]